MRRLLAVHAHPDDETLATGIALADAVRQGVAVTVVTCTLGEQGEVMGPPVGDLGPHRERELAAAMAALGVRDHRLLAQGRWRDSGMRWLAPGRAGPAEPIAPGAFALADVEEAAAALAEIVAQVQPQVVLTYDPRGGYDHPDHVQAHRVTMRAVELVDFPIAVHWCQIAASWAQAEQVAVRAAAECGSLPDPLRPRPGEGHPAAVVADELLDVVVTATPADQARVEAALLAHRTQVRVMPPWFSLADNWGYRLRVREGYRRVSGPPILPDHRPAPDLFAGLDLPHPEPGDRDRG